MERRLERERRAGEAHRTYDLSPETLGRMADRCELRWDHPAIRSDKPSTFDDQSLEDVGLDAGEREAAQKVLEAFNARALAEVRRLYTEVTGDENTENLAPEAMMAEINDKTDKREVRQVFERLAAERAGRTPPPGDIPANTPFDQLYRLLLGAGDSLEAELADVVGAKKARGLRDAHDGWGSKSRSSYGCPERTP